MTTVPQLPGMKQGLQGLFDSAPSASGAAESVAGEGFAGELKRLFEHEGVDLQDLPPELQALLRQWLEGGAELPLPVMPAGTGGEVLPAPPGAEGRPEGQAAALLSLGTGTDAPRGTVATLAAAMNAALEGGDVDAPVFDDLLAAVRDTRAETASPGASAEMLAQANGARALPARELLAMPVPQPVGSDPWGGALGERLRWMVKGDVQQAELKLTPPNLGPLEVRLTINDDKASVSFVSHHALVRDAIEAALPRLREMLAQESLQLVQADVGDGARHAADGDATRDGHGGAGGASAETAGETEEGVSVPAVSSAGSGLLDLFV